MFNKEALNPGRYSIKIKRNVFKEGSISLLPNNITKDGTKQQKFFSLTRIQIVHKRRGYEETNKIRCGPKHNGIHS